MATMPLEGAERVLTPYSKRMKFIDIAGVKFGRLTAQWPIGHRKRFVWWLCSCDCGNLHRVAGHQLRRKGSTSCGCRSVEIRAQLWRSKITHGMSQSPEFKAYSSAKARCNRPTVAGYKHYGNRGIKFKFASFQQFYDEVGSRPTSKHSLDRIDVNGHYEIGNVRWATHEEQAGNKRNRLEMLLDEIRQEPGAPISISRYEENGVPMVRMSQLDFARAIAVLIEDSREKS